MLEEPVKPMMSIGEKRLQECPFLFLSFDVIARNSVVAPVRCNQLINCAQGDINFIGGWLQCEHIT